MACNLNLCEFVAGFARQEKSLPGRRESSRRGVEKRDQAVGARRRGAPHDFAPTGAGQANESDGCGEPSLPILDDAPA